MMRVFLLLVAVAAAQGQDRSHGRSMVIATGGIVATSQTLASQAGAYVLSQGGSAVDAAIAANAVLGVVEPNMCGIGGDLFALHWDAKSRKLTGLNSSGWAPSGLTKEFLQSKGNKTMPRTGIHSATVPGCVDGWRRMHGKFGKLPWRSLFTAAIRFADQGWPMQEFIQQSWESELARKDEAGRRVFFPGGAVPRAGELMRNPELASAMRRIAEGGADEFYKGAIAKAILATSARLGGTMSAADLSEFSAEWVEPISTDYRGWRLYELPPNGQGIAALTMLNILETFTPDARPGSAAEMHRKIEAMKLAYADLKYVGDPRMVKVPVSGILSKGYARERARLIDEKKANCEVKAGEPRESSDTTYFSVVDREGNIVSWIQSVAGLWGSGVMVDGMGFHLHNRGGGFRFEDGHANALAPRKRPFHTIIPGLLEKGEVHIGFGIMSGANQPLAHAQFASYVADYGMNLQQAMEGPRFTKGTAAGCEVTIESRFGLDTLQELSSRGHKLDIRREYTVRMGRGNAVMHNSATKMNFGASDPRADGAALPEP